MFMLFNIPKVSLIDRKILVIL